SRRPALVHSLWLLVLLKLLTPPLWPIPLSWLVRSEANPCTAALVAPDSELPAEPTDVAWGDVPAEVTAEDGMSGTPAPATPAAVVADVTPPLSETAVAAQVSALPQMPKPAVLLIDWQSA